MNAALPNFDPLADLDVFYGDLTVSRATVYARLPASAERAGMTLAGHVRGPRCATAQTLPATAPLVDLGPGPTLLARALVTDPSFWSPDLPAIYDVVVELRRGSEVVAQTKRQIGFRPLGVRGKWILREEKPWVLRGVMTRSTNETDIGRWREAAAVLVDNSGDDWDWGEASRLGVPLFASIPGDSPAFLRHLRRFVAQPAGTFIAIAAAEGREAIIADIAKNVVTVQSPSTLDGLSLTQWAKIVTMEVTDERQFAERAAAIDRPVIAMRPLEHQLSVADARAACDQLQRDLAPFGQYAGYVV
jgi:hypothetical protein